MTHSFHVPLDTLSSRLTSVSDQRHNGWVVQAHRAPIASLEEMESLQRDRLKHLTSLPNMLFSHNRLVLANESDDASPRFSIYFDPIEALEHVASECDKDVFVREANAWEERRQQNEVQRMEPASDWTFTSGYRGTVTASDPDHWLEWGELSCDEKGIPYDELKRRDLPVSIFAETLLYEDEVDDHGISRLAVQIRVMDSAFWYARMRQWVRIDDVMLRIVDTRYFYRFGSNHILREVEMRQSDMASVQRSILSKWCREETINSTRVLDAQQMHAGSSPLMTDLKCLDDAAVFSHIPVFAHQRERGRFSSR